MQRSKIALLMSDLPKVDSNFVYTIIAVLGAIGSAWLTHRWDSKREKEKDEFEEERKNKNIRKAIYLELKFYDEQFEKLYSKGNPQDKQVRVLFDSEEARRLDNLADPTRIQYEKMAPESIVGAFQEEEILDELRYAYDAIDSFFEKYPFELTSTEKMITPGRDTRHVDKEDIEYLRSKIASGIEKIKKFDEKMPFSKKLEKRGFDACSVCNCPTMHKSQIRRA